MEEDKLDHALECYIFDELCQVSDISRIMARLLLKLNDNQTVQDEKLPFNQGRRAFCDLMSHSDKVDDDDAHILKIFHTVQELIPHCVKDWSYFKEVYGKLVINSFEVSNENEEKVGWALYLGPSILDHSCVPSAEVDFSGKRIIVKSKVNMTGIDLRKLFISYIDIGAPTSVRRSKLKQYYHFDCFCERCLGVKLGWVVSQPFNEKFSSILLQKNSITETIKQQAKGKDKDYLSSIRCQKCSGRPVAIKKENEAANCSYCDNVTEKSTLEEYFEVKRAVEKVIDMEQIPADAAPQCMELMTGLFHPYDLTYIEICSLALTDCLLQNSLKQALEYSDILLSVIKKFAKGSPAHIELIERIMTIHAEMGEQKEFDKLVQCSLVDLYDNTNSCVQILKLRDSLYETYFSRQS